MPVFVLIFPFVKDLKPKCPVAEPISKLLPGDFLADNFKDSGKVSFVDRVLATFELLAFAFYDQDMWNGFLGFGVPLLDDEIWIDGIASIPLDGKLIVTDKISIPPQHLRLLIEGKSYAFL